VCIHSKAHWFLYYPCFFTSLFESGNERDSRTNQYLPRRCSGVTAVGLLLCSSYKHATRGLKRGKKNLMEQSLSVSFVIETLSHTGCAYQVFSVRGDINSWGEPNGLQTCSWKQRRSLIPGIFFPCCHLDLKFESPAWISSRTLSPCHFIYSVRKTYPSRLVRFLNLVWHATLDTHSEDMSLLS